MPTDRVSGTIPLLWSTLPTDRVSGHDTTALDDAADLTAQSVAHQSPDIVGGLVRNRMRRVSATAEIYKHIFCM